MRPRILPHSATKLPALTISSDVSCTPSGTSPVPQLDGRERVEPVCARRPARVQLRLVQAQPLRETPLQHREGGGLDVRTGGGAAWRSQG